MNIEGKVVVVTGASSGIGEQTARVLAQRGAVPVLMARSRDKLERLAAEIGGGCGVYRLDVQNTAEVNRVFAEVLAEYGRIDVLVNNAGFGVFERFLDAPLEQFEEMMDVNYMGIVRCTKAVLPAMVKSGSGHIVNIASMAGKIGSAKSSGYSATKHAVLGLTNSLRQELAGTGVRLSAVNPGPIDTPFFERADPTGNYVKNISWFMLKPERVAGAIIRAVEKEKAEIDLPFIAGIGTKLYSLFPRLLDKSAQRMLNKK
ncbi:MULTISPECIES: SDR family oxidoreductase [unclassified Paenibacillus]|uniref:SDR family NAD(P)-dependent oxidoreductase n=1 Tax=unclassified Paenibacillus TaxID=185978 RepID=UPI0005676B8B|nr:MULTISPECIES: SDR family oxidoreductase [unclassified Paenibacillus]